MDHRLRVVRVDAWHWRAVCTCGQYRSKHWDRRAEAEGAWEWHMRLVRRQTRNQERREHRTNLTPMRYV